MKKIVLFSLLVSLVAFDALAQEAPAPRRMPRTPVSRETLEGSHNAVPSSREVQGPAIVLDGEKLRIGQTEVRLFGVVPPQLAASFGPQARAQLDALVGGQNVTCRIRDRDHDGRLLATCTNASGNDMALDLLKRGLAVSARGTVVGTELAAGYLAAEQAAQIQRIGLWSMAVNTPAPAPAQPKAEAAAEKEPDSKKEEKSAARAESQAQTPAAAQAKSAADALAQQQAQARTTQANITAAVLAEAAQAQKDEMAWETAESAGFFERYQILISGILILLTAVGILAAVAAQKIRDRRDEMKALAAALRGELMAARGVCLGRAKSISNDAEDRAATWPRIRITLYQAYVGRLGLMGSELARQIASVYGQSSDYAALYNPTSGSPLDAPKKQALETLIKRIDEVLPKLAEIERTGKHLPIQMVMAHPRAEAAPVLDATAGQADIPPSPPTVVYQEQPHSRFGAITGLWEHVQNFLLSHRAPDLPPPLPPLPIDPSINEYTALIEADMERYQYTDSVDTVVDAGTTKKKRK